MHTSIHSGRTGNHPASPHAMVLRLISCSPRRSGFLASVAGGIEIRQLDASVEASGLHDFAVRDSVPSSEAASASTASHPASVTIAIRPFWWDETAMDMPVIWVRTESGMIFGYGDRQPQITPNRIGRRFATVRARSRSNDDPALFAALRSCSRSMHAGQQIRDDRRSLQCAIAGNSWNSACRIMVGLLHKLER